MTKVVTASVSKSLDVVGTIAPVSDASPAFQVGGKVTSVGAVVGDTVTAGETLASLDPTSLSESVSSAQSTVDSDEAKLTQDEDSQTSTTTTTTPEATTTTTKPMTTTTTTPSSSGSGSPGGTGGASGSSAQISQDQATLVSDQSSESTDQQQEAADLAQAESVCGTSSSPSSTTTTTTTTTTATPTSSDASACTTALEQASSDQDAVSADQTKVSSDETKLAEALTAEASTSSATATTPTTGGTGSAGSPTQSSTPSSSTASTASTPSSSGSNASGTSALGSTSSDSAEQIASDEASIDSAKADLVEAQQSLDEAQLTSPINGTISSVGISVGDTVSAGSSTSVIVIIGTQSYEVTGTLSSAQVESVKVGDSAQVAVDGKTVTLAGTVATVGPVQSSTSGYTYPVVVALPAGATGLYSGSTANVAISTGEAHDVLALPSSAVMAQGTRSYVQVLSNGDLTDKTVKVGIVGDDYTQIVSGLKRGSTVVLADYSEAVPSSNATTTGGFGGGGGGFSGGSVPSGFPSGGFSGG
jgi:multidrug efflux pump subunit AcrA (membrane-fusion protein)